MLTALYVE